MDGCAKEKQGKSNNILNHSLEWLTKLYKPVNLIRQSFFRVLMAPKLKISPV